MYMYKLCKTALIYNSNNTYSMESFHKSYVTNAVVCVEPWIKILQHRFTCRKKKVRTDLWLYPKYKSIEKKTTSIFFGQNVIENKKDLYSRAWLFVKIYHTSNIASYFKHNFHRICKNCTNLWSDIVFSLRSQGFYNRVPLKSWRHLGEGSSVEPTVHGDCSVVGSRLTTICLWIWILSQFQKAEEKTKS